ncbi:RNA polymerase sigma factor [Actinospica sp.]|uniref:RNA polymerase sigma factor n=1 Tax=Actinospica sp. TaxID=1872142 RepID=UPI002BF0C4E6|nr:RNA polymerase sigma factor [Actinospica sp.]HWG27980.1 RNA polymerase sigma factor [Actinospica sp.]
MGAEFDAALEAARGGAAEGVAVLWRALNPALERYLAALVGQAAQDIASETWLQAARDLPSFRGDAAGFRVWLFRIGRNRAIDEQRRAGRRREELLAEPGEFAGAAPDAAAVAEERWGTDRALALLARLPREQAEAVLLRSVAGLDANECGRILGKRPGAVRVAAMRGLRGLAAMLEDAAILEEEPAHESSSADVVSGVFR